MRNLQAKKQKLLTSQDDEQERVGLGAEGHFDKDIYGGSTYDGGYVTSIAANDEADVSNGLIIFRFHFRYFCQIYSLRKVPPPILPILLIHTHAPCVCLQAAKWLYIKCL